MIKRRGNHSIRPSNLADLYYDIDHPAAYGSVNALARATGLAVTESLCANGWQGSHHTCDIEGLGKD